MRFEIINPSDKAFIEGEFLPCCLATVLFGRGQYALKQIDGDLEMPLFLFGKDPDGWFTKTFGKNLKEAFDSVPKKEVGEALLSVKLFEERTSLNDFTRYAHILGAKLVKGVD